ncbi:Tat pathway signal protein [Streptomyces sp. NPDC005962]|uniref:Tat pathway signal protein n=1 Tax=Streptomyces sp. NPDC005962 TaxID=3154466 RepID=UPI0033EBCDD5
MDELGFAAPTSSVRSAMDWRVDPLIALTDLGRLDLDVIRRHVLSNTVYSVAGLTLPQEAWWSDMAAHRPDRELSRARKVGRSDVDSVQEIVATFSRIDQRRGGGHGRRALVEYLRTDVAGFLSGHFSNAQVRRDMFSAAAELAYLSGWMAFDNQQHAIAQHYFTLSVKLAATADNPPLVGHILRAMAHQAVDLGHHQQALHLATASMNDKRYNLATPRERALLGVIYARSLAATGQKHAAAQALLKAEDDLTAATPDIKEPSRTFFFAEASLAHETACTLRDSGDPKGAVREFRRSVKTRKASSFRRTHAVTLGYLASVQASQGSLEEACSTWSRALDAMEDGVYSGRARDTVVNMRRLLSPYRPRGVPFISELDARAAAYLSRVD